jgi:hypothetical protein
MAEKPKLAVILGAGASHDVCPEGDYRIRDRAWQPPLTDGILQAPGFIQALDEHVELQPLLSSIRADLATGMALEESLRRHRDSSDPRVRRQMRFFLPALQRFFYGVGATYTREPANYSVLIERTVCRGIHTAFVTVNYDTLLETSLARIESMGFSTMESYVSSPDWLLAKLHGSAGWGYPWDSSSPPPDLREKLLSADPLPALGPSAITVLQYGDLRTPQALSYPALALPADDKPGFVCPPQHVEALIQFLADCDNFLFIGFSGKDKDLLDLLAKHASDSATVGVVGKGDVPEVAARIQRGVPQFSTVYNYGEGFSVYLVHPAGIDALVARLKASSQ